MVGSWWFLLFFVAAAVVGGGGGGGGGGVFAVVVGGGGGTSEAVCGGCVHAPIILFLFRASLQAQPRRPAFSNFRANQSKQQFANFL